jgi:hypothetical protein
VTERKDKDKRKDEDTTEFDNFQELLEQVLSVPKEELDKRRKEWERDKERRKQAG